MGTVIGEEVMIQQQACESGFDPRTISDREQDDDGKTRRTGSLFNSRENNSRSSS
ncbi:unnamed protein product [Dovyalis caffra]|uniref:Uncharacterized protein n=1 Tax=Dovyalis caffra TaxID=77055 RepID=A0AAV1SK05_9ROSI|nr:unnamed protein product [Dovyalis caffra]